MKQDASNNHVLPLAPIERLIRRTTFPARVGKSAVVALDSILEEIGLDLAKRAADLAKHVNRATVLDADITLAYKQWRE